jgi:hypothetical protein
MVAPTFLAEDAVSKSNCRKPAAECEQLAEKYQNTGLADEYRQLAQQWHALITQIEQLFRGRLTNAAFAASEANLVEFIKLRGNTKPHLIDLTQWPIVQTLPAKLPMNGLACPGLEQRTLESP